MDLISGRPFWPLYNGLLSTYPPLDRSVDCDVVIIGAGITGALVAYHLAEAGASVVVVDKRDVATGSTAASTCLLQYEVDVPLRRLIRLVGEDHAVRSYRLCLGAISKFKQLNRQLDQPFDFSPVSSFYGASTAAHVPGLKSEFEMRRQHGFDVEWWTRKKITRTSTLPHAAAIFSHDAAQADPHRLTHVLLAAARGHGARIFDRTTVTGRQPRRHGVDLRTDRGPRIRAKKLVVATGYETEPHLADSLTELLSTFALITEPVKNFAGWPRRALIWETARPYVYLRTTPDHRIIIGGYDEPTRDPRRREKMLPQKTGLLARRLRQLLPKISFEVASAWTGSFAETPDGLPYIGEHPRVPHTYFALGYGGNGITYSLVAAEIIRDLFFEHRSRDAELFRFDRQR